MYIPNNAAIISLVNFNIFSKRAFHLSSSCKRSWGTKIAFNTRFHWMNLKKIMQERASFPYGSYLLLISSIHFSFLSNLFKWIAPIPHSSSIRVDGVDHPVPQMRPEFIVPDLKAFPVCPLKFSSSFLGTGAFPSSMQLKLIFILNSSTSTVIG